MSRSHPPTEPTHALSGSTAELGFDNTAFYRAALHELIDLGMALARQVHERAITHPSKTDPTIAFDRISRAIRRTIYLAHTLDDPPKAARTPTTAPNFNAHDVAGQLQAALRTTQDIDDIEDIDDLDDEDCDGLERLDGLDINDIPAGISRDGLIALICRDLNVTLPDLLERARARHGLMAVAEPAEPPARPPRAPWTHTAAGQPTQRDPNRPDPRYPLRL